MINLQKHSFEGIAILSSIIPIPSALALCIHSLLSKDLFLFLLGVAIVLIFLIILFVLKKHLNNTKHFLILQPDGIDIKLNNETILSLKNHNIIEFTYYKLFSLRGLPNLFFSYIVNKSVFVTYHNSADGKTITEFLGNMSLIDVKNVANQTHTKLIIK